MMKKLFVILVSVGALAVASPAVAATHGVTITKIAFVPNSLTITTGDSVTWTNSDTSNHQVVSQQAGFASPMLKPGDTFTFTYSKAGKFSYTDSQDKSLKGTVTVQDVPGNVSLQTSATLVTFGGSITLSGVVSNKGAGENVEILRQECNKSTQAMERVTTVQTTTGGAFSFTLQPTMKTTYQVKWKSSTSPSLSVAVRPRIRLGKVTPRRFTVTVAAGESLAGHVVTVQRWRASIRRWVGLRTATLRVNNTGVAPTVLSSVTFTANVPRRTRLRVVMTQTQAGACFAPGVSNSVLS